MPSRTERETVIVANLADLDEGWFTVETTEEGVMSRLRRIAGTARLQVLQQTKAPNGRVVHVLYRVPADCWSGLGVKRKRVLSEAQKEARMANLAKSRPTGREN